jgi:hypothetical protein
MLRRKIYWHDDEMSLISCVAPMAGDKRTDVFCLAPASYSWVGMSFVRFSVLHQK